MTELHETGTQAMADGHLEDWIAISICTDCVVLICNGDTPPEMNEGQTQDYLALLGDDDITPGWMYDGDAGDPDYRDDDLGFSWSPCDACRRPHNAGDRYKATSWTRVKVEA